MDVAVLIVLAFLTPFLCGLVGRRIDTWRDNRKDLPDPQKSLEEVLSEHRKEKTSRFREQTDEWTKEFEYLTRNEPVVVKVPQRAFIYSSPDEYSSHLKNIIEPVSVTLLGWKKTPERDWFKVQHGDLVGWMLSFMLFDYYKVPEMKKKVKDLTEYEIEDTYHVYSIASTDPIMTYHTRKPV